MAYNLYFNAAATDPKSALCKSVTNLTPNNPPAWVAGESRVVNLYIADGFGDFDPISGDATASVTLGLGRLGAVPTGGTFTIASDVDTTGALAYNATAADLQTALNLLANITAEGGVIVTGAFPVFAVDWVTVGAKGLLAGDGTLLTPDSAASVSRVRTGDGSTKERQLIQLSQQPAALQTSFSLVPEGWSAAFNLNTRGIVDLVGTQAAISDAYLELRVVDGDGNVRVYGQVGNIIRNRVIDPLALVPTPLPAYLTADTTRAQFVQNRSTVTALTGGTAGCLDAILTANDAATPGWLAAITIDDVMDVYQLQTGGDAESVPDIIRPDDFDEASNLKIWRRVSSGSGGGGGDAELKYWTESTEQVATTPASQWTPNNTGLDPVPPQAVPDVQTTDQVIFGNYPAGTYRVNYMGGAMQYFGFGSVFRLNASAQYGFRVVHSGGVEIEGPGNSYTGYASVAQVEAVNAGAFVEFTHTGGTIGVRLEDNPLGDNLAGTPSPTFALVGANADVHAVIQPRGVGSVILADDTGAPPAPTADAQLTTRFAGGYRFGGGNATFEGTAAGDDPVAAQDFVTKAWGEANFSGGGGGVRPPVALAAGVADYTLADIFTHTLTADLTISLANVPDGGSLQILLTQPSPVWAVTWPAIAWVGGGAAPLAPAGLTTIFTFERVGAVYHGVAALASEASDSTGEITAEAGAAIAARQVVWQDVTNRLGNGRTKWYPEDLAASPPNVGPVRGMALTADDGEAGTAGATWTARDSNRSWWGMAMSADGVKQVATAQSGQIYTSTNSGATWTAHGPTGAWQCVASSADGVKLVASTNSTLYTSSDSGVTWIARTLDGIGGARSIASSADGTKLVAASDVNWWLYTSSDSGVTWIARTNSGPYECVASSADGVKLVAAGLYLNIWTSTDSGVTWVESSSGARPWNSVASSDDGVKLVAVATGKIYTSADSGTTWMERDSNRQWQCVASSADGVKLVAGVNAGQLYVSSDSGATWTARESSRAWLSVACAGDGSKMLAGDYGGQLYTSEGGAYVPGTFTCLTEPGDVSGFAGLTPGARQFSHQNVPGALTETEPASGQLRRLNGRALSATVLRFDPRGFEPQQNATPLATRFLNELGQFSTTASAVAWGGITGTLAAQTDLQAALDAAGSSGQITAPAGAAIAARQVVWQDVTNRLAGGATKWYPENLSTSPPNVGPVRGLALTADDGGGESGVTWTPREASREWIGFASSSDGTKLFAAVLNGQLYTSTDSGVTWTVRNSNRSWRNVASSADGTKLVAVVQNGQLYTSTDSGVTWTARDSNRSWYGCASSSDGTKLFAAVSSGQLYTSTNSGVTWTARDSNRSWRSVASSADGTKLVAAVYGGQLYTSTDSGVTWTARDSNRNWLDCASSSDGTKLVAAVYGGQLYTSTDSGVTWTARESNRNWKNVASSSDGTKLVAAVYGGQLYTSTDSGVTWTARDSNRNWRGLASSADGNKLVTGEAPGFIYTSVPEFVPGNFTCLTEPGDVAGFTGLTPGAKQFSSQSVPGALTETEPTSGQLRRLNGHALSDTTLRFDPRASEPQQHPTPLGTRLLNEFGQFAPGLTLVDAAPATSGSAGTVGQCFLDPDWFYYCIATDTWRRVSAGVF